MKLLLRSRDGWRAREAIRGWADDNSIRLRVMRGELDELWGEKAGRYKVHGTVPGHGHANRAKFRSACCSGCSGAALAWPGNSAHVSGPGCRIRDVGFDFALVVPMLRGRMSASFFFLFCYTYCPPAIEPLAYCFKKG